MPGKGAGRLRGRLSTWQPRWPAAPYLFWTLAPESHCRKPHRTTAGASQAASLLRPGPSSFLHTMLPEELVSFLKKRYKQKVKQGLGPTGSPLASLPGRGVGMWRRPQEAVCPQCPFMLVFGLWLLSYRVFRQKLLGAALPFPPCFALSLQDDVPLLIPRAAPLLRAFPLHSPAADLYVPIGVSLLSILSYFCPLAFPSHPPHITPLDSCLYQTSTSLPSCPCLSQSL